MQNSEERTSYSQIIGIFNRRTKSVKSRMAVGFCTALFHAYFATALGAAIWCVAIMTAQAIEIKVGKLLIWRRTHGNVARYVSMYRLSSFAASVIYSFIAPMIWFGWGDIGKLFTIVALCGAILHGALTQATSRRMLFYSVTPHAFWLLLLPVIDLALAGSTNPLAYFALLFVAVLYLRHTIYAAGIYRQSILTLHHNSVAERRQREAAEALTQQRTELFLEISHEIRTPLNGVIGMLELLSQRKDLPDHITDEVNICWQSALDLKRVANDRLDVFIANEKTSDDKPGYYDISPMLERATITAFEERRIPRPAIAQSINTTLIGYSDKHRAGIGKVLTALFQEVAASKISKSLQLNADSFAQSDNFFSVFIGFSFETEQFVSWQDGEQADYAGDVPADFRKNTNNNKAGIIFDLRKTIAACDSINAVLNTESIGSKHTIVIELAPRNRTNSGVIEGKAPLFAKQEENLCGLIVDDNRTNRQVAKKMLEKMNIETDCCEDGTDAVEKVRERQFDIILMDLQMPKMDGDLAAKEIRKMENYKTTPIIAISANCNEENKMRFSDAAMNAYLEKPFTYKEFEEIINKFIFMDKHAQADRDESNPTPEAQQAGDNSGVEETMADDISTLFDVELFKELCDAIDVDGAVEIINTSIEEITELCTELDQAQEGDEKRRLAHKIKGCASSACAIALSNIAADIETQSAQEGSTAPQQAALSETLVRTRKALETNIDDLIASAG